MPFVKVIYSNQPSIEKALNDYVAALKKRPEIKSVYLCGSRAKGKHCPYSDMDLLILLAAGDQRRPHERIPDYLPDRFPVSLDLFIYTEDELTRSRFAQQLLADALLL